MTSRTVTAATAAQVAALYERLWDTSPRTTTRRQRAAVELARRYARENGWRPGLAWDDIDTDPDTGPAPDPDHPQTAQINRHTEEPDEIAIERAVSGDITVPLTRAEEAEVTRRLTAKGCSIRTIADLLGTTTRTVSRHRKQSSAALTARRNAIAVHHDAHLAVEADGVPCAHAGHSGHHLLRGWA